MKKTSTSAAAAELRSIANPAKAELLKKFFKTGKGEYAEEDNFLGVMVPEIRKVAKKYSAMPENDIESLLASPYNEERLTALIVMGKNYKNGDEAERERLFRLYVKNMSSVNNWNLVDLSAPYISGPHLENGGREFLHKLSRSNNLWERRIAIISCSHYIRNGDFADALKITATLMSDKHDLIHKACGWMLREIGKKDEGALDKFLKEWHTKMPRTMLRYAIERMPEPKRQAYLKGQG